MNCFQKRTLLFVLSTVTLMAGQSKTLEELTRESQLIVLGQVAAADSYVGPHGEVYTDVAITPESLLKDTEGAGRSELRFTVKGGVIGDLVVQFSDSEQFTAGESVVLFRAAGQPVEKLHLDPASGQEVIARIERFREDAGESVPSEERLRAVQFMRTIEQNGRERGGVLELDASACAALMGPKWATPASTYRIDPALPAAWAPVLQTAAQSWNNAGSKFAFSLNAASPHLIALGDLGAGGPLASTRVEYYQSTKQLVKFSMTFNTRYTWSTTGEAGKFDVQGVATHELGHALGLTHPSATACSEETMWASAGAGETKKRSLEAGDKDGVATLYGAASATVPPPPPPAPVPTAPVVSSFALVTTRAVATRPLVMLVQGTNIDPAKVQALITGGMCGTGGCIAQPYAASTDNIVFINTLAAGHYSLVVRNTTAGTKSAARTFTVNAN